MNFFFSSNWNPMLAHYNNFKRVFKSIEHQLQCIEFVSKMFSMETIVIYYAKQIEYKHFQHIQFLQTNHHCC